MLVVKFAAAHFLRALRSVKMTEQKSFLRDLDEAVQRGTAESRARALWHTTDLMITGRYSEDEIWTFGEVIGRLADEIEVAARAQLAKQLARFDQSPVNIIHKLAFDDSIEVAGPILRDSVQLEPYALVANVCTKDQSHMLAIAQRKSIDESVTDVLVTRGNQEVVKSVVKNDGARFSDFGFLHMIQRAEGDNILAEQLGLRKDIPRHVFQQLIAKASDDVRKRLERERPSMVGDIQTSVSDVTGELQSKFGPVSRSYFVAKRVVMTQHKQGNLNETSISGYARFHKLEEVTIGLSLLCALPVDVIERAVLDKNREMLLILAKALDFSWATTMSLLFLGAKDHRITAKDLKDTEAEFGRLNVATSRSVLKFYQTRKTGGGTELEVKRQPALAVH
jgi:putative component of toxin-antitoxin plasmid stabilization module